MTSNLENTPTASHFVSVLEMKAKKYSHEYRVYVDEKLGILIKKNDKIPVLTGNNTYSRLWIDPVSDDVNKYIMVGEFLNCVLGVETKDTSYIYIPVSHPFVKKGKKDFPIELKGGITYYSTKDPPIKLSEIPGNFYICGGGIWIGWKHSGLEDLNGVCTQILDKVVNLYHVYLDENMIDLCYKNMAILAPIGDVTHSRIFIEAKSTEKNKIIMVGKFRNCVLSVATETTSYMYISKTHPYAQFTDKKEFPAELKANITYYSAEFPSIKFCKIPGNFEVCEGGVWIGWKYSGSDDLDRVCTLTLDKVTLE